MSSHFKENFILHLKKKIIISEFYYFFFYYNDYFMHIKYKRVVVAFCAQCLAIEDGVLKGNESL